MGLSVWVSTSGSREASGVGAPEAGRAVEGPGGVWRVVEMV